MLIDNAGGTAMAVEYMLKSGRRNIAYIGRDDYSVGKERFDGYVNALDRSSVKINKSLICLNRSGYDYINVLDQFIKESLEKLFAGFPNCDYFVCFSSLMAYKAYSRIKEMGCLSENTLFAAYDKLQIPDLDFENRFILLERPLKEIGRIGAETMLSILDSGDRNLSITKRILPNMYLPSMRKNSHIDQDM